MEVKQAIFRYYKYSKSMGDLYEHVLKAVPRLTEDEFGEAVVEMCREDPGTVWQPHEEMPLVIEDMCGRHTVVDPKVFKSHGLGPMHLGRPLKDGRIKETE